jgi:cell wall assembly regulator SMI1
LATRFSTQFRVQFPGSQHTVGQPEYGTFCPCTLRRHLKMPNFTLTLAVILKAYLDIILGRQKELNYFMLTLANPPASQDQIVDAESELGFEFNDDLKSLYLTINGCKDDFETPSGKTGIIPIHSFLNLKTAVATYKSQIEFIDGFTNLIHDFTPGTHLFPFLSDGSGNFYWVDLNKDSGQYGMIYWTNSWGDEPDYQFKSLSEYFRIISEAYRQDIFFLDKDQFLDCHLDKWQELENSGLPRLKNYS